MIHTPEEWADTPEESAQSKVKERRVIFFTYPKFTKFDSATKLTSTNTKKIHPRVRDATK